MFTSTSPSVRRPATRLLLLATAVPLLTACGPGTLQLRDGSVAACTEETRGETLGWVSVAPLDRFVAAIDRMGTRSGLIAQGASVRDRLAKSIEKSAGKSGMKSAKWYDWSRPMHVVVQHDAETPKHGVFAVLPLTEKDALLDAVAPIEAKPEPGATLAWQQKGSKEGVQATFPHPSTVMIAASGERLGSSMELAKCVQLRRPEALVQVGVDLQAVAAHYKDKLDAAIASLAQAGSGPFGAKFTMMRPYREMMTRLLEGAGRAELGIRDDGDDIVFDITMQAREGSELAASIQRMAGEGPSPLLERLPASSWLVSSSVRDRKDASRDIELAISVWKTLLKLDEGEAEMMQEGFTRMLGFAGGHAAFALLDDDGLPIGMLSLIGSDKPTALRDALRDDSITIIRTLAQRPALASKMPPEIATALEGGWSGLLTLAKTKLAGKPIQISWSAVNKDGLSCDVLRVDIDQNAAGGTMNPMARQGLGIIGERLEAALCAGKDTVSMTFGRDAVALAAAAVPGRSDGLMTAAWAKRHFRADDTVDFGLWPSPLVDLARRFLPNLPTWPAQDALAARCGSKLERCSMAIPAVAIAKMVRSFSNRGR